LIALVLLLHDDNLNVAFSSQHVDPYVVAVTEEQ
jgi:hypothetical protein